MHATLDRCSYEGWQVCMDVCPLLPPVKQVATVFHAFVGVDIL